MWLAVLGGLGIGVILNLGADCYSSAPSIRWGWLQRREQPLVEGNDPSLHPAGTGLRVVRWAMLLLLSVGLWVYMRAQWHAIQPPGSSAPTWQWVVERIPEITYCSLLVLIATIDLEHRLVPDVLILAGLAAAVGLSALGRSPSLRVALAGAAVGGGLFLLMALARPNAMGAGDAKLAFLIGMLTGFPWVLQALVLGVLLGGLAAALLLLSRVRGPKQYIPYAPYLAAGGIATLLHGQQIAQWYARLVGTLYPLLGAAAGG